MPEALFFLLGDIFLEKVEQIVQDKKDWPEKVGPPPAERRAEIAQIDKAIGKIETEVTEIKSLAKQSGIVLRGAEMRLK